MTWCLPVYGPAKLQLKTYATRPDNGWEVARRAREIFPDLPVVYVTSMAAEQWTSQGVPKSILIQKPFAPAQITTAISQLLNAGEGSVTPSPI